MKLVSFETDTGSGFGALAGDRITLIKPAPGTSPETLDVKSAIAHYHENGWPVATGDGDLALNSVRLLPPVPNPGKIICVATNFREQANEGKAVPDFPIVFTRYGDSFTGHQRPLIKPVVSDRYDFEGELAVIIGRSGRNIAMADAMNHVAGYSCLNDGSVRDWQKHSTQFTPGKNFYRSGSFGPWMITADEVPDYRALALQTRVNGVVKQEIGFDRMIFEIPWLISYFSTFTPLAPGDVIATGTPSGFGSTRNPPEFLAAGDRIEVDISGVGTLINQVMCE